MKNKTIFYLLTAFLIVIAGCNSVDPAIIGEVTPSSITFDASSESYVVKVKNTGEDNLVLQLSTSADWIVLSKTTLTIGKNSTGDFTVTVNPAAGNLTPGQTYDNQKITIVGTSQSLEQTAGKSPSEIEVSFNYPVGNEPPEISEITYTTVADASPIEVHEEITFTANASDPEGGVIQYRWDFGDGFTSWSGLETKTHTFLTEGSKTVTVEVREENNDEMKDNEPISITINSNTAPNIVLNTDYQNDTHYPGESIIFDAHETTDQNSGDDNIEYSWFFQGEDDSTAFSENDDYYTHTFNNAGTFQCFVRAKDEYGKISEESFNVTIETSGAPVVSIPIAPTSENITHNSVVLKGNITYVGNGASSITDHGFCISTSADPTPDPGNDPNTHSYGAYGDGGVFEYTISDLQPLTEYYVVAYAINNAGVMGVSTDIHFETRNPIPPNIVTTGDVVEITNITATANGTILCGLDITIQEYGHCWSESNSFPTISDGHHGTNANNCGPYSNEISNFSANTSYYIRAYVKINDQYYYGNVRQFTTNQ